MAENSGQRVPLLDCGERRDMFCPVGSPTPEVSIRNGDAAFPQAAGLTEVMVLRRFAATICLKRRRKKIHSASYLLSSAHPQLLANKGPLTRDSHRMIRCQF